MPYVLYINPRLHEYIFALNAALAAINPFAWKQGRETDVKLEPLPLNLPEVNLPANLPCVSTSSSVIGATATYSQPCQIEAKGQVHRGMGLMETASQCMLNRFRQSMASTQRVELCFIRSIQTAVEIFASRQKASRQSPRMVAQTSSGFTVPGLLGKLLLQPNWNGMDGRIAEPAIVATPANRAGNYFLNPVKSLMRTATATMARSPINIKNRLGVRARATSKPTQQVPASASVSNVRNNSPVNTVNQVGMAEPVQNHCQNGVKSGVRTSVRYANDSRVNIPKRQLLLINAIAAGQRTPYQQPQQLAARRAQQCESYSRSEFKNLNQSPVPNQIKSPYRADTSIGSLAVPIPDRAPAISAVASGRAVDAGYVVGECQENPLLKGELLVAEASRPYLFNLQIYGMLKRLERHVTPEKTPATHLPICWAANMQSSRKVKTAAKKERIAHLAGKRVFLSKLIKKVMENILHRI